MEKKEAIEILQEEHDWVQEPCYVIKAIEMAIDALKMPEKGDPLTIDQLREVPHGKIKDSTLKSICDRANEIASIPAHIDREAWKPCGACKNGEITVHVPEFRAMAVCNQHMDHAAFDLTLRSRFCPWCGRPLTEEAWAELEKRLRGCMK